MRQRFFYKSIETVNIGAFPLLPDASDPSNEGTLLFEFLTKILTTRQVYDHVKGAIPQKGLQYENALEPHKEDLVLVGYYKTEQWELILKHRMYYVPAALGKGSINLVSGFERTRFLLLHHGEHRLMVRLNGDGPRFYPKTALEEMGFEPTGDYFLGFDIKDFTPVPDLDPNAYQLERKRKQSTTPYFTTIDKLK